MIYLELFLVFFKIGLFTFGGGYSAIPLITDEILSRNWLSQEKLITYIGIGEATPGPFAVNIATFIGAEQAGFFGSIVSTLGFVTPSILIIIMVAILLERFLKNYHVRSTLTYMKPVMVALIFASAIGIFINALNINFSINSEINLKTLSIILLLLLIMKIYKVTQKKKLHPIIIICISAVLGILVYMV